MSLKGKLFTYKDLHGGAMLDSISAENIITNTGLRSRTLLGNPIFQEAVSDIYTQLVLAEDEMPVDMTDEDNLYPNFQNYRIQRRLLRQVVAYLDNKCAEYEALEETRRQDREFNMESSNEA